MTRPDRVIRPFRAVRYQIPRDRDLSAVLSPPYDIISEEMQRALHQRDEHNFVRIELPMGSASEKGPESRYHRAAGALRQWMADGILVRERTPSCYVLEQEFSVGGRAWRRRGVFALVRLPEEGEKHVLSHEGTLPEPKADRLRLLRACRAMASPIMLLCEDPDGRLASLLGQIGGEPDAVAQGSAGTIHRTWIVSGAPATDAICRAVGAGPLFIADGHHRFETAMSYREEMRRAFPEAPEDAGFNFALALVTSARDPGLVVLPTHRLISGLDEAAREQLRTCMERSFEVRELPCPDTEARDCQRRLEEAEPNDHVLGMYCGDSVYRILVARDEAVPGDESVVAGLDVSVLHDRLVDPVMAGGACPPDEDGQVSHDSHATGVTGRGTRLTYTTDEQQAVAAVDRGDYDCAFFVRRTRVADVLAAARAGERMPGKSTYFYPKVPAGIVLSDASSEPA